MVDDEFQVPYLDIPPAVRGDSYGGVTFVLADSSGPVDLSAYTVTFSVYHPVTKKEVLNYSSLDGTLILGNDGLDGTVGFASRIIELAPTRYIGLFKVEDVNGHRTTLFRAVFMVIDPLNAYEPD